MIFTPLAIVLTILTGLWIYALIAVLTSTSSSGDYFVGVFGCGVIFIGLFGWFVAGHIFSATDLTREVPAHVIKTDTSVLIELNGNVIQTYTDIETYKRLSGLTNVTMIEHGYVDMYYNTNFHGSYSIK